VNPNEWNAAIRELEDQRNIGFSRAANAAVREAKLAAENAELKQRIAELEAEADALMDGVGVNHEHPARGVAGPHEDWEKATGG